MTGPKDDLEAVRAVATALEGFQPSEQERIIRWAREKLGLSMTPASQLVPALSPPGGTATAPPPGGTLSEAGKDLKTFIAEKKPKNDVQFAAAVAYYHRFEAPATQRKAEINHDDLQEACRLASRERLKVPAQTLRNAHTLGLLDKGNQPGYFTLNSVGENLVAMTLPANVDKDLPARRRKSKKQPRAKAASKKAKA